jgi:hypothetical protein
LCLAIIGMVGATSCGDVNTALQRLVEARQLSADLIVQFTKAADASNRAVMADSDDVSAASAREAEQAKQSVQRDVDTLGPILQGLGYGDETKLLQEFVSRFGEYKTLDLRILGLAVENTNLKARQMSFGPAYDAVETFRTALEAVAVSAPAAQAWHARALVATAVAEVREIEVLQQPHIAEADDAVMNRLQARMALSETAARNAVKSLAGLTPAASRPRVAAATAALDQFMDLNAQIVVLSRRNTNVRSLALSLDEKRKLIAPCEENLHALQAALATHHYPAGR